MANTSITSVGGVPELIDAICTFAAANGWTVNRNTLASGLRTATISITGVTGYLHLFNTSTSDNLLRGRISLDYNGALAPSAQGRVTADDMICDLRAGPIPKVWLFENDGSLHIVCAISLSSAYRHVMMGMLDKVGDYAGGTYMDMSYMPLGNYEGMVAYGGHNPMCVIPASSYGGSVHADCTLDGRTDFFHKFTEQLGATVGAESQYPYNGAYTAGLVGRLVKCADQNTFSGRSVLHPIRVFVRRTGTPSYSSPAGVVVGSRWVSINKFAPEAEVVIGSDTWQLFPLVRKKAESAAYVPAGVEVASGDFGVAVLKS